jgi:DNA-binding MarR family transcriptional regulator
MPTSRVRRAAATPAGQLSEAKLHQIIGYQVVQASITTMDVFMKLVGGPFALRPVEYTILTLINENPGGSPARLSKALAVTPPNITVWIDKLEQRGLVARERSTTDRRAQHLRATPEGARRPHTPTQLLLEGHRAALAHLRPAARAMLIELLHKVACARST